MSHRNLFASDHRSAHRAILGDRLGLRRPFDTMEAHDEGLIARWNAAVRPCDTVWHLGDFSYRCPEAKAWWILARLNGAKRFLVRGNHDRIGAPALGRHLRGSARAGPTARQVRPWDLVLALRAPVLTPDARRRHPPLRHSHGSLPGTAASTDVGVDRFGFSPVTLDEIRIRLAENAANAGRAP